MNPKPALWLSIGLTAFILFFTSSIFQVMASGNTSPQGEAAPAVGTDSVVSARELAYQQLIDQANTQLLQAQAALAAQQSPEMGEAPVNTTAISAEEAAVIAQDVALTGTQPSGEAELVDFQGTVAYEVPFDAGNVYVDAATGEVLYNGTISLEPSLVTAEQAAQIAANYLGRTDIYRVDMDHLNGVTVFRVKFMNSDAVFVDQYGQILLVRLASAGSSGNSSSGEHEGEREGDDD